MEYEYLIGGETHVVKLEKAGDGYAYDIDGVAGEAAVAALEPGRYVVATAGEAVELLVAADGARRLVAAEGHVITLEPPTNEGEGAGAAEEIIAGIQKIRAPMPGKVVKVAAAAGDAVAKGQTVVVVEAMKMEHPLVAAGPGVVKMISCEEGQNVDAEQALAEVEIEANG